MTPEGPEAGTDFSTDEGASQAFSRLFAPEGDTDAPDELDPDAPAPEDGEPTDAEAADAEAEDTPDEEPVEADPASPVATILLDDGTELTLEEVKKGHLRQADYTRKTQAVAEERKAVQAEKESIAAERTQYHERIVQLDSLLQGQAPADPPLDLRQTDPAEYAARKADVLAYQQQLASVQQERQRVEQLMVKDATEKQMQVASSEREKLLAAIPEWKDKPEAVQGELDAMRATGLSLGFTDQELDSVIDHRAVLLLREVTLARQAKAAAAKVQPKIAKAPVLKPGTTGKVGNKPTADSERVLSRFKKNPGDTHAAAAVFDAYFKK